MNHIHHHHANAHHELSKRENGLESSLLPSRTTIIQRSRVLIARASCTNDSDDGCRKPTRTPTTVIIVAIAVPVVVMVVVLLYLHRRHGRKLMEEDAKGNYVSDDFGMQGGGRKGKTGPEMRLSGTEKNDHGRGISTDVMSPYILPPGLHGSRESFHSLSRSMKDPHDPYGQVVFGKGDGASINSERQSRHENGSVYTTSSGGTDKHAMNNGLLKNAQTMPRSQPPRGESRNVPEIKYPDANAIPLSPLNPFHGAGTFPGPPPPASALPQPASKRGGVEEMPSTYAAFTSMEPPTTNAHIPRIQSQAAVMHEKRDTSSYLSNSSYGDAFQVTPPSPHNSQILQGANPLAPQPLRPHNDAPNVGLGVSTPAFNPNRLSMSVRPLPPDDPSENQEERANRIRSFYKEYFDDSKPEPVGGHVYDEYYEDYGSEYLDGAIFDTESGAFVVVQPHSRDAAPVTRRAMTPPPRAPPRFRSNTGGGGVPRMSGQSSNSSSRNPPRNMSSMSGRPPPPKKPLPAPTPLASLPTPAKLTENAMMFDPNDFAPPISYRDRQAGRRPDSPLGESRPYSPAVRAHTPLVGSYDDLAAMPSPHVLRKSGTFTALDFAPPPRFRDVGGNTTSDAGSIRSNRSGMSAAGRMAVRTGAYRVSRIQRDVVGTKDDLKEALRPKLDMGRPY